MSRQDYRILIVDDEPANIYLLSRMLGDSYRIVEARGGEEALAIARGPDKPALILLDVMMPEVDGFEVCRRLKADDETKDIIVIFVTAIGDSAAEEVGLNLGAADYITKPISLPIVRARVRNQINMRLKADMLEAMSYIDGLTHVYNRRKFDTLLHKEWQRARHSGKPLGLIMIDFDHFKALNDHYGHGAGDICLQQGAAALGGALKRQSDLLARYGGEEFVALLPETDLEGARLTAEAMRAAVKALGLEHKYSSAAGHVTVSLGVAAVNADGEHAATYLLELADRALNRAKASGRDRAVLMDEAMDAELNAGDIAAPRRSDDALARAEARAESVGEAQDLVSTDVGASDYVSERRRYGATSGDRKFLPQAEAVLHALNALYLLPLSAELHAELDSLHYAASDLLSRLDVEGVGMQEEPEIPAAFVPETAVPQTLEAISQGQFPGQAGTFGDLLPTQAQADSANAECFDVAEMMRRLGQDQEIAELTIQQFLADAPVRVAEIRAARDAEQLDQLHFKAHSLKGLSGAVSALRLQALAGKIEKSATILTAAALMEDLEQEYAQLEPLLRAQLDSFSGSG
ncbi:diguanylate cyclase [Thiorhodovibrio frisius]|uniref:diguanylate cyclase n=1 Tax=Thiorhodovibrio frisius TaxID=631362 RepID=UPI0028BD55A9|nr:diguanylate cyclase [Thiorhodovibrio frisius]